MIRSKARDISATKMIAELDTGAALRGTLPKDAKREKPLNYDYSFAEPLGIVGRKLVWCFIESVKGLTWGSANARYQGLRPFFAQLSVDGPLSFEDWDVNEWADFTNRLITKVQVSAEIADGTKNFYQTHVTALMKVVWRKGLVKSFDIADSIKNPTSQKKLDIASVVPSPNLATDTFSEAQRSIVDRLQKLTQIDDPEVHAERAAIMLRLLREHAEREIRRTAKASRDLEAYLSDAKGLDVEQFLSRFMLSHAPLRFKRGWQKALSNPRDLFRFLCRPLIFGTALFSNGQNCVKQFLNETIGLRNVRNALHPTIDNVIPFLTLNIIDLNNEVSSANRMKFSKIVETENPNVVEIVFYKGRSHEEQSELRRKGYVEDLELGSRKEISVFQSTGVLKNLNSRIRHLIPEEQQDSMFIVAEAHGADQDVRLLDDSNISKFFHRFRRRDPILKHFHFSPDKIRGTEILRTHLEENDVFKTFRKARHKSLKTTQRYIGTVSASHANSCHIREIHDVMLLNALPGQLELREKLGIDEEKARLLTDRCTKSGFLEWYLRPGLAPPTPDISKQSDFMRWLVSADSIFIESPEVAAEIITFRQHILTEAPSLRQTSDWWEVWAPLFAIFSKALAQMRPDVRLQGDQLARYYQIEYSEEM